MFTQALMAVPALTLWALTIGGAIEVWMVYALVFARGAVNALDNPARQSFVTELVGTARTVNAVALNSVIVHTARIVGPALAGVVIALVGVGPCFLLNALSFGAMLVALWGMDAGSLETVEPAPRARGDLRRALSYVARTPALRIPLAMMALVGTLSFNFQILLPLLADFVWHGTATTYALLTTAMGVGSVTGALVAGARGRVDNGLLVGSAVAFGAVMLLAAAAPSLELQVLALVPLGAVSVTFAAGVNSALQIAVEPGMRGRVMALYSVVFLGSTPIGAPFVGWLAEVLGPRAGLVVGGLAALAAAFGARVAFARAAIVAGSDGRRRDPRGEDEGAAPVARPRPARAPQPGGLPRAARGGARGALLALGGAGIPLRPGARRAGLPQRGAQGPRARRRRLAGRAGRPDERDDRRADRAA
jgi:MFS family permease